MTQNTHKAGKRMQERKQGSEPNFSEQSHYDGKYISQNTPFAAGVSSEPGTYFQGFITGSESPPRTIKRALYDSTPPSVDVKEQGAEQKGFSPSNTRKR